MDTHTTKQAVFRRRRVAPTPLARPTVLLIRGCPRTGTTIVAAMINASLEAAVVYEYAIDAMTRDLRVLLAYEDDTARRWNLAPEGFALTDAQREGAYFNDYGDPPNPHYPTDERFGNVVTAVVEAVAGKRDVRLIGSKTPGSTIADEREALEPYFADIRYLFMVRNPVDTINSMLNRRNLTRFGADEWEIGDVEAAIAEYRQSVLGLLSHAASHPDACYVVSFEDLEKRSVDTLAGLERFLDVDLAGSEKLIVRENDTKSILTFEERSRVEQAFASAIRSWDDKQLSGPAVRAALALQDCVESAVPGKRYRYNEADGRRDFLGAAWHPLEEGGVWSSRPESDLFFSVQESGEYVLSVEISCYLVGPQTAKAVSVELNDTTVFSGLALATESEILDATEADTVRVFLAPGPRTLVCGPITLEGGRVNRLVLSTDDVRSPQKLGVSTDARPLGLYLHGLQLSAQAASRRSRPKRATSNGHP